MVGPCELHICQWCVPTCTLVLQLQHKLTDHDVIEAVSPPFWLCTNCCTGITFPACLSYPKGRPSCYSRQQLRDSSLSFHCMKGPHDTEKEPQSELIA